MNDGVVRQIVKGIILRGVGLRNYLRFAKIVLESLTSERCLRRLSPNFALAHCRLIRRFVRPGDVCVDIGANLGVYTHVFLSAGAGYVHAFEPMLFNYEILLEGVEHTKARNVSVMQCAVSDKDASALLMTVPKRNRFVEHALCSVSLKPKASDVPVSCVKLDSYFKTMFPLQRVRFIKCDVEGHEGQVIEGAWDVLVWHSPILLCEVKLRNRKLFFKRMRQAGYSSYFMKGSVLVGSTIADDTVEDFFFFRESHLAEPEVERKVRY